jgi:hypothetical protein
MIIPDSANIRGKRSESDGATRPFSFSLGEHKIMNHFVKAGVNDNGDTDIIIRNG